jgi:hypothetical protein
LERDRRTPAECVDEVLVLDTAEDRHDPVLTEAPLAAPVAQGRSPRDDRRRLAGGPVAAGGPRATLLFRLNLLISLVHGHSMEISSLKACHLDTPVAWKEGGVELAERPTAADNQKNKTRFVHKSGPLEGGEAA